jgi:hypothetical protein
MLAKHSTIELLPQPFILFFLRGVGREGKVWQ